MKNKILKYYTPVFLLCFTFVLFAQPGNNDTGGGLEGNDPVAYIDNYVWIMVIVGLTFVFMKFRAIQKKKMQGE